jgi:hypothetical protein
MAGVLLCFYLLCMFSQPIFIKYYPDGFFCFKAIGLIGCLCLNRFRDGTNQETTYSFLAMMTYTMIFNAQGVLDSFYWKQQLQSYYNNRLIMRALFLINSYPNFIAWINPSVSTNVGSLFSYPLYIPKWL